MQNARNHGTFKVYIRKKCDHGPFLDSEKVENLPHHFHSTSVKKTVIQLYTSISECSLESKKKQLKKKLSFVNHDSPNVLDRFSKGKSAIVTLKQELQSCNNFIGIRPPKRACCKKCKLAVEDPDPSSANQDESSSDFDQAKKINVKTEAASTSTTTLIKKEASFTTNENTTVDSISSLYKSGRKSKVKIFIRRLCSTGSLLDPGKISKLPPYLKSNNISNLSKIVLEAIAKCAYDVERVFNLVPYGSGPLNVEAKIGEFLQRRSFPHTHSKKELTKLLEQFAKSVGFCENFLTLSVPSVQNCKMCRTKRKQDDTGLAGLSEPHQKRQKLVPRSIECKELRVVINRLPDEVVNRYLKPATPKTKEVYFLGQKVTVTYTDSKYLKTPEKVLFRDAPPLSHTSPIDDASSPFLFPVNTDESLPAALMIDDVNIAPDPIDDPLSTLFEKDNQESSTVPDLVDDNEFTESAKQCERSLMDYSPKPWDSDLENLTVEGSQDSGKSDSCGHGSASSTVAPSESQSSKESLLEAMKSITEAALPEVSKHQVNQVDIITKIVTVEKSTEVFIRNCLTDSFRSDHPFGTTSSGESSSCISSTISKSSRIENSSGIQDTALVQTTNQTTPSRIEQSSGTQDTATIQSTHQTTPSRIEKSSGIQDTVSIQNATQTKKLSHLRAESGTSQALDDLHSKGRILTHSPRDQSVPNTRQPNDITIAKNVSAQGTQPLAVPGTNIVLPPSDQLSGQSMTGSNDQTLSSLSAMNSVVQNIRGSMLLTTPPATLHSVSPNVSFNQFQATSPTYPLFQPFNPVMTQSLRSSAFQWGGQRSQPYRPQYTTLAQNTFPLTTYRSQSPIFARQSQIPVYSQRGAVSGQKTPQSQHVQMSVSNTRPFIHSRLMSSTPDVRAHGITGGNIRQGHNLQQPPSIQSMARLAEGPRNGAPVGTSTTVSYPQGISASQLNHTNANRREIHQHLPLTASSGPRYSLASNTDSRTQAYPVAGGTAFPQSSSSTPQQIAKGVVWFPPHLTRIPETPHRSLDFSYPVVHHVYTMQNAHTGYASAASTLPPSPRPVNVVTPQQCCNLTMCITNSVQVKSPPQYSGSEICNPPSSKNANGSFQVSSLQKKANQTQFPDETHQTTKPVLFFSKGVPGPDKARSSPSSTVVTCTVLQQNILPKTNRSFAAHTSQWPGSLSMAKEQSASLSSFSADAPSNVITSTASPGNCVTKEQSLVQSHTNYTPVSTNASSKPSSLPIVEGMNNKVNSRDIIPTNLSNRSELHAKTIGQISPNDLKATDSLSKPIKEIETTKSTKEGDELYSISSVVSKLLGTSKMQENKTPNFESEFENCKSSLTTPTECDASKKESKTIELSSSKDRKAESNSIELTVEKISPKSSNEVQKARKSAFSVSTLNKHDLSKSQLPNTTKDVNSAKSPIEAERQKSKSSEDNTSQEPPAQASKENEVSDSSQEGSKTWNASQSKSLEKETSDYQLTKSTRETKSNEAMNKSLATKDNEDAKVENVTKPDLPKSENVKSNIQTQSTHPANSTSQGPSHQHVLISANGEIAKSSKDLKSSPPPEKLLNVKSTLGALLSVVSECESSRKERVKVLLMSLLRKIKAKSTISNDEISVLIEAVGPVTQESESFKRLLKGLSDLSYVHGSSIKCQDEKPSENADSRQESVFSKETSRHCGSSRVTTNAAPKSISCGNSLDKKSLMSSLTDSFKEASNSNNDSSRESSNIRNTGEDLIVDPKDTQGDNMTSIIQKIPGEKSLPEISNIEVTKSSLSDVTTGLETSKVMVTQEGNDLSSMTTETSQILDSRINNEEVSSCEMLLVEEGQFNVRSTVDASTQAFPSSLSKNIPSRALHPPTEEGGNEDEEKPSKMIVIDEGEQPKLSAKSGSEDLSNRSQQLSQVTTVGDKRPHTVLEQGREQLKETSSVVDVNVSTPAINSSSPEQSLLKGNEITTNSIKLSSFERAFPATAETTDAQHTSVIEKSNEPKSLDQNENAVSTTSTHAPSQTVQEMSRSENAAESSSASELPLHTRFMDIIKECSRKDQKRFNTVLKGILHKIRADRAIALSDLNKLRTTAPVEFRKTKEFKELMNIFRQSINSVSGHPSFDGIIDLTSEESDNEVTSDSATEGSSRESPFSSLSEIVSMVQNKVNAEPTETSSGIPTESAASVAMSSKVTHAQTQIIQDKIKDGPMETFDGTKTTKLAPIVSSSADVSANNSALIPEAPYSDSSTDISLNVSMSDDVVSQTACVNATSVSSSIPGNVPSGGTGLGARTPPLHGSSFVQIRSEATGSSPNTHSVPQSIVGEVGGIPVDTRLNSSSLLQTRTSQTPLRYTATNRPSAATTNDGQPGPSENPRDPYSRNTVPATCQSAATTSDSFVHSQPGNYSSTSNPRNNTPPSGYIDLTNFNPSVMNRYNMHAPAPPRNSGMANNASFAQSGSSGSSTQASVPHPAVPPSLSTRKNAQLPKPIVSISAVPGATVLMWDLQDKTLANSIASYEIYAIQLESSETITQDIVSSKVWTPLGVIKSLPLPMAITLNNLREGLKNYIVVRAVDLAGRTGPFSSVCEVKAGIS